MDWPNNVWTTKKKVSNEVLGSTVNTGVEQLSRLRWFFKNYFSRKVRSLRDIKALARKKHVGPTLKLLAQNEEVENVTRISETCGIQNRSEANTEAACGSGQEKICVQNSERE